MDVKYINPFIKAVVETFDMMLDLEVHRDKLELKSDEYTRYEISAIIGMSGRIKGNVVLSFRMDLAKDLIKRFLGLDEEPERADVVDGIGELVNIVAGSAKKDLSGDGLPLQLSLPSVIAGEKLQVFTPEQNPAITIFFQCELGKFSVDVSMRED